MISKIIHDKVVEQFERNVSKLVDDAIKAEMEKALSMEYEVSNQWGEKTGKKINIRSQLLKCCTDYWGTPVNDRGEICNYGSTGSRAAHLIKQHINKEFADAIAGQQVTVLATLKDALKADAIKSVTANIDKLFKG